MITTVMLVQRFATKTLYTRARATDGSTMLAPMSPGAGKGLKGPFSVNVRPRTPATTTPSHGLHIAPL